MYFIPQIGFFTRRENLHFEVAIGTYYDKYNKGFEPSLSLAFRKQNPGGKKVFRMGIALPEYIFIGFGRAF